MLVRRLLLACTVTALAVWTAVALAAAGSPDPSFGQAGKVTIDRGGWESVQGLALQPDGKIVLAGSTTIGSNAAVYRLNPNGTFDTAFDGDGVRDIDSGGGEWAHSVALQADGKIVVGGMTNVNFNATVHRLNANGSLDPGFDGDGAVLIDGGSHDSVQAVAAQPDGKILVASQNSGRAAIFRLNPNGSPDPSFDGDGRLALGTADVAMALAVRSDGRILVAGDVNVGLNEVLYRLNPNGSLDAGFDGDGKLTIDSGDDDHAQAVAVQPNGMILLAGFTWASGGNGLVHRFLGGPDTTPPSVPTGLTCASDGTTVTLAWNASSDDSGSVGYRLYRDGAFVGTFKVTSTTQPAPRPGLQDTFEVSAFDGAGNVSALSEPCSAGGDPDS